MGANGVISTVALQAGDPPAILFGFGAFTVESSIDEARELAVLLVDALEQARRGGVS